MKFLKNVLALAGCFALAVLLSCGTNLKQQTPQIKNALTHPQVEQQIAELGKAATVLLVGKAADRTGFAGSGFFVRGDLVVTNVHVLSGMHGKSYSWRIKPLNETAQYTIKGVTAKVEIGNISEAKADLQTALKLVAQENDKPLKTNIEETLGHLD